MYLMRNLLNLLTIVALIYTLFGVANAKNRCLADLSRVDQNFCLSENHITGVDSNLTLKYKWKVNDGVFDLTSNTCLSSNGITGERQDIVIAIDRSFLIRKYDLVQKKTGADMLSMAKYIIEKYSKESIENASPNISLVMFSSSSSCSEYSSGGINVDRTFPCLYVPAGAASDETHVTKLKAMLTAAEDLYSQGGMEKNSDLSIVSNILTQNIVGMNPVKGAALVLFSDARSYAGEYADVYAYLRSENYTASQDAAVSSFSKEALKAYNVLFAMNPTESPALSGTDTYDTMCALPGASDRDCKGQVVITSPSTWPVNKIDFKNFALQIVSATGGKASQVVTLTKKDDIDPGLEILRYGDNSSVPVEAVSYSIDGSTPRAGKVVDGKIQIDSLPSDDSYSIELYLKVAGVEFTVPATIETDLVAPTNDIFRDGEMECTVDESLFADPNLRLKNLQGGSGSCGVVGAAYFGAAAHVFWLLFITPLMIVAFLMSDSRKFLIFLTLGGATLLASTNGKAEESGSLNVIQYHPVVDGAGMTEKASSMKPGSYNVGLFMDYANDAVEIGSEEGERESSVMDDVVTAHMVGNIGLFKNVSFGINVPYVHKSDVDRTVEGEEVEGGNIGLPSDAIVNFKLRLYRSGSVELGFMPIATLPTGDTDHLLGDGTSNYGALFLISGVKNRVTWALNMGYLEREEPLVLEDDRTKTVRVRGQALTFAGAEYKASHRVFLAGNVQVKISTGEGVNLGSSSPSEWSTSIKYKPTLRLDLQCGVGTGIGRGYGSPDYRAFAGFSYLPSQKRTYYKPRVITSKRPARRVITSKKPRKVITSKRTR